MPSSPLGRTNGRTKSGMASHHRLWTSSHSRTTSGLAYHYLPLTANTVKRLRAWHAIIAFGQHTRSNDIGHGMTSPPLDCTHGRMKSGVACHHRLWAAHTVERCSAWHDIIDFKQHTRLNDVGRGMLSCPLDSTHGRTTSGVACHHSPSMANTVK